jgi:hypothetical protein
VKVVRGRAEARWLPSRHRFALFRLWAFARLRNARPEPRPGLMLVVDPEQTAVEVYSVSTWLWLTTSAYFAYELAKVWPLPLALLAALPLASLSLQAPLYVFDLFVQPVVQSMSRTRVNAAAVNSASLIVLEIGVAAYYALERTWVRLVAWQFLALVGLNAIAATIVYLLRGSIARLEATYECGP